MVIHLRKIMLFVPIFLLLITHVFSQKVNSKKQPVKKQHQHFKQMPIQYTEKAPADKENLRNQTIPQQTEPKVIKPKLEQKEETLESLVKFFVDEADVTHLIFEDKHVHIDSILPYVKGYLERFKKRHANYKNPADSIYLKDSKIEYLYNKINKESEIFYRERTDAQLNEIRNLINILPNTKEKVGLFLKYAELNIHNDTYYTDIADFIDSSRKIADMIPIIFEQKKAYNYIGDFAADYHFEDSALQMYYNAHGLERYFSIDDKQYNLNDQGHFYKKIAYVFYNSGIGYAQNNALNYYETANHYFSLLTDILQADLCKLYAGASFNYLCNDMSLFYRTDYSNFKEEYEVKQLLFLKSIYNSFGKKDDWHSEERPLMYYNLGGILQFEGEIKSALYYFIQACIYSTLEDNYSQVDEYLGSISHTYAILGNKKLADEYTDLQFNFEGGSKLKENAYTILGIASNQFNLKNFDSVIYFSNKLQYDTALRNYYYPPNYNRLLNQVYDRKCRAFDSLKTYSDSVLYYKNLFLESEINSWSYYASLLNINSYSEVDKIKMEMGKEIYDGERKIDSLKNEKGKLIELNDGLKYSNLKLEISNKNSVIDFKIISEKLNRLGIEFEKLKGDTNKLGKLNRNLLYSIKINRIALDSQKMATHYYDSLSHEFKKDGDKYKKQSGVAKTARNIALILLGIAFTFLLITLKRTFKLRKNNKKLKNDNNELTNDNKDMMNQAEANRLAHDAELQSANEKVLRELTLKHEIAGLISELYLGYENRFLNLPETDLVDVAVRKHFGEQFANLESFSKYYYKLLKNNDYNSIDEEIELCRRYVEVVKIKRNNNEITFIDNRKIKQANIVLPHHILNNFNKNSIENGEIIGKTLHISIEDEIIDNNYVLNFLDDGKGLPVDFSINKTNNESTGFKNIFQQIEYFNTKNKIPYTIIFNENSMINRSRLEEQSGVKICLTFKRK